MNHPRPLLLLVLLTLAGMLGGCAQTPRERWVQQRETISVTQDTAIELHRGNVIGDDAMFRTEPWIKAARAHNGRAYLHLNTSPESAMREMDMADRQLLLTTLFLGGSSRDTD